VRRRARWAPTARGEVARGGGSACKAGVAGEVARMKRRAAAAQCARPSVAWMPSDTGIVVDEYNC
jgi:hypothetical protein